MKHNETTNQEAQICSSWWGGTMMTEANSLGQHFRQVKPLKKLSTQITMNFHHNKTNGPTRRLPSCWLLCLHTALAT